MDERRATLVMIPTYNEAENVETIVAGIAATGLDLDILFVDDNSPDGTGRILERLAADYPYLNILHRSRKQGIGSAHKAGRPTRRTGNTVVSLCSLSPSRCRGTAGGGQATGGGRES